MRTIPQITKTLLMALLLSFQLIMTGCGAGTGVEDENGVTPGEETSSGNQNGNSGDGSNNGNNGNEGNDGNEEEPSEATAWILDQDRSHLNFVTTKKIHAVESHRFEQLDGLVDDSGLAIVQIDLNSVNTGVALRDQRMRELLFDVASFPFAEATTSLDLTRLEALPVGGRDTQDYPVTLNLHGMTVTLDATLTVQRLDNENMLVQTAKPVLVNALDFDFADGLNELRSLANLASISTAVPVDLFFIFQHAE